MYFFFYRIPKIACFSIFFYRMSKIACFFYKFLFLVNSIFEFHDSERVVNKIMSGLKGLSKFWSKMTSPQWVHSTESLFRTLCTLNFLFLGSFPTQTWLNTEECDPQMRYYQYKNLNKLYVLVSSSVVVVSTSSSIATTGVGWFWW